MPNLKSSIDNPTGWGTCFFFFDSTLDIQGHLLTMYLDPQKDVKNTIHLRRYDWKDSGHAFPAESLRLKDSSTSTAEG